MEEVLLWVGVGEGGYRYYYIHADIMLFTETENNNAFPIILEPTFWSNLKPLNLFLLQDVGGEMSIIFLLWLFPDAYC